MSEIWIYRKPVPALVAVATLTGVLSLVGAVILYSMSPGRAWVDVVAINPIQSVLVFALGAASTVTAWVATAAKWLT